jgi:L-alanine-DL-glutamate epimerase-like enolase superfamily enzyme
VVRGVTTPTLIRACRVSRLDIPLHSPFGISGGVQEAANNVLVTIELADGTRGHGEAAPFPAYNGETQAVAFAQLSAAREWLAGRDARHWRELAAEFRSRGNPQGAAQCGLEMALLDALTKSARLPLWSFFGGAGTQLETDMTVTTGEVAEAGAAARAIVGRGIRIVKVKVGGTRGVGHDLARIEAIRAAAPDAPLILDGNGGLSRADASELARGLRQRKIVPALLEQWLAKDDLAGLRALGEETGWTLAADESVATSADACKVVQAHAAHVINVKLMKAGIVEALEIVAVARALGCGLMIGGNVESILAMTMSACFAAGQGGFHFADLDTPLFLAENPFDGGYALHGGQISVAEISAGHGVTPRE